MLAPILDNGEYNHFTSTSMLGSFKECAFILSALDDFHVFLFRWKAKNSPSGLRGGGGNHCLLAEKEMATKNSRNSGRCGAALENSKIEREVNKTLFLRWLANISKGIILEEIILLVMGKIIEQVRCLLALNMADLLSILSVAYAYGLGYC